MSTERLDDIERRVLVMEQERHSIISKLDENTLLTQQVVANTSDLVNLFVTTKKVNRGFIILAKWIAAISAGVLGVSALWHLITGWFTK